MAALRPNVLRRTVLASLAALSLGAVVLHVPFARADGAVVPQRFPALAMARIPAERGSQTAVLAGGCFWGMETIFEHLKGVRSVTAGYSGGAASTAHYEMVSTGLTGHAEAVKISYDPSVVGYGTLLAVYFSVAHDPTQLDRQAPDDGPQYRSSIFYATDAQRRMALSYLAELRTKKTFAAPVVTTLVPLVAFYPAEADHQHFALRNPSYPYIVEVDEPRVEALRKRFPSLYTQPAAT